MGFNRERRTKPHIDPKGPTYIYIYICAYVYIYIFVYVTWFCNIPQYTSMIYTASFAATAAIAHKNRPRLQSAAIKFSALRT